MNSLPLTGRGLGHKKVMCWERI